MPIVTIAGDLAPVGRNLSIFESRSFRSLVELGLCPADGIAAANLECPLSDTGTPITKGGPNLRVPARMAGAIKEFGISTVSLANNHILDYGEKGLDETRESLTREGIGWFGAGATREEAAKPLTVEAGGARIEFFGFAEKEYNYSAKLGAGASILETPALVRSLRGVKDSSFAIAMLHAGNEYFEYPSPWLRDTCRLAVELGAKVVVCQHSHCIGSYERYAGGLIVYGQGNFVFDSASTRESWWLGLLVQLQIEEGTLKKFGFVPFRQDPGKNVVVPLEDGPKEALLAAFEQRSMNLRDEATYLELWDQFCERNRRMYQSHLFGLGKFSRRANKLLSFCDLVPRQGQRNIGNALRCQSHLEVLRHLYSREKTC